MSATIPSSASAGQPSVRQLPAIDGATWVAIVAVAAGVTIAVGRLSPLAFAIAAAAVLVAFGFAAWRWPLPTLVAATVTTLVDPEITPLLLPEGVDLGPIGMSEPLLLVTGGVIAVDAALHGRFMPALRDPVLLLLGVFIGLAVVSAVLNGVPAEIAGLGILMTVDALAVYFAARMLPVGVRGVGVAVGAVVAVALTMAVFGIAQAALDPNLFGFSARQGQFGEGSRISSWIGNPNMVAAVIGLALPFAVYGSRRLTDRRLRWAARVTLLLFVWALLLTFSRGAWLSVAFATLVGTLLLDWRALGWMILAVVLAVGATTIMPRNLLVAEPSGGGGGGGGGGGTGGESPPAIVDSTVDRFGNLTDRNDTRGRYLRDGMRVIEAHPVLGVGPGRYGGGAAWLAGSPFYESGEVELFGYRTVHNFWLHLLGESGVLGTAVFLTIVAGLLIRLVREAWRSEGLRFVILAGAATMLMVASVNSVTEMIFEGNMPVLIVWLVVGLASLLAPVSPILPARRTQPAASA